jgi:hypothetical protein
MAMLKAKVNGVWVPVTAGGGASEEVYIGATDPGVTTSHELWFDSDAVSPADTSRWNSAWGVIATGTFIPPFAPHVSSTTEAITNAVTATLITGRRYKVRLQIRAIVNTSGATTISFYLSDNGTQIRGTPYGGDPYVWSQGAYQGANYEWQFFGDNTSHSFVVWVAPSAGMNLYTDYGLWYIEDVGPISYGIPPAIDPTPTSVAWTPFVLLNSYDQLGSGGTELNAGYRKVSDMVQLKGTIRANAGTSLGQAPFRLSAGYYNTTLTRISGVGFLATGNTFAWRADLQSDGNFYIQNMMGVTPLTGAMFQLNGVSWPVGTS